MSTNPDTILCLYRDDPPNNLTAYRPSEQANIQRFFQKSRLATEVQGWVTRSVFQHGDQLLAQHPSQEDAIKSTLLATDQQRSGVNVLDAMKLHPLVYTPYGHQAPEGGLLSMLGFNGERPDPVTGHYVLGNGYRAFNPVLMRFNCPDSWSPFGNGGLNPYAYCVGDPINYSDPTGHSIFTKLMNNLTRWAGNAAAILSLPSRSSPAGKGHMQSDVVIKPLPRLDHMPWHVKRKIIGHLSSKDALSLAQTSRSLKESVYTASEANFAIEFYKEPRQGLINLVKDMPQPPAFYHQITVIDKAGTGQLSGVLPREAVNSNISPATIRANWPYPEVRFRNGKRVRFGGAFV